MNRFAERIRSHGMRLRKASIEILQINVGRLCNLTCVHCHVESGPTKTAENMDRKTAEAAVRWMDLPGIQTVDLTGGAPEMNAHFRYLVTEARRRGLHVIDRCNLTILTEPGREDLAGFLAENQVEVVASLPCYSRENVDKQRGKGTFMKSIEALRLLNRLGYGRDVGAIHESPLQLTLVYNPVGAHLPPAQAELEKDYRRQLKEDFGIDFNRLLTIANMPITRYEKYLRAQGDYDTYVNLLEQSFNPQTVEGLMCRNTLSVGWDGRLYDCDFNQALGMAMKDQEGREWNVRDVSAGAIHESPLHLGSSIQTGNHCFGCTAGAGSGCQGALK